jgi:ATP-binding cassette subfamily F protein 2
MTKDLTPTEGDVRRHLHLSIGRYHQHSMEVLDPDKTVLDFIRDYYPEKKMEEEDWRKAIGRYGITGTRQKTQIGKLSDGLKTRIIFAMLALESPNMLLLDEPTNHLDMECIDSLAEAINAFNGGLVLVSHDFRLINQVAKEIWICDKHAVTKWSGDIRSYKNSLIKTMKTAKLLA